MSQKLAPKRVLARRYRRRAMSRTNSSISRKNSHRCGRMLSSAQKAMASAPPSRVEPSSSRPASRALVPHTCWPRLADFITSGM
ncbi:hypothetical protein D3C78_1527680 [compost metagenome]